MIIKTTILPQDVIAITLFPFIFTKRTDAVTINHEKIHLRQQAEMLIVFFYVLYLLEAIFKGYDNISFEKEAYYNESDIDYLKKRKLFAWIKYLKNQK